MKVTDHADGRIRERLGIPRSAIPAMAERAFNHGLSHAELNGILKTYVSSIYLQERRAGKIKLYAEHVWIFAGDEVLITVYRIAQTHVRAFLKLWRRLRASDHLRQ